MAFIYPGELQRRILMATFVPDGCSQVSDDGSHASLPLEDKKLVIYGYLSTHLFHRRHSWGHVNSKFGSIRLGTQNSDEEQWYQCVRMKIHTLKKGADNDIGFGLCGFDVGNNIRHLNTLTDCEPNDKYIFYQSSVTRDCDVRDK